MQDHPETVQMSHAIDGVTVIGIRAAETVSATNLFKEIEALLDSMTETRHTGEPISRLCLHVCDDCHNRNTRKGC